MLQGRQVGGTHICEREISGLYRFRADPDLFRFWVPRDRLGPGVSRKPADPVTHRRWALLNVQQCSSTPR